MRIIYKTSAGHVAWNADQLVCVLAIGYVAVSRGNLSMILAFMLTHDETGAHWASEDHPPGL